MIIEIIDYCVKHEKRFLDTPCTSRKCNNCPLYDCMNWFTNNYTIDIFILSLLYDYIKTRPMAYFLNTIENTKDKMPELKKKAWDTITLYHESDIDYEEVFINKAIELVKNHK